ncbi:urease accessory protein UreD [Paenibacillus sp. P26]|nr:urease accessory protein UreD [Paenibacillus sp. P26]
MPKVTGSVSAEFTAARLGGDTELRSPLQSYPLKIAKTFPFEERQLGVYLMDASPGIMAGDRYELDFRFGDYTRVFITNQSYTKVHPARKDEQGPADPGSQRRRLTLGAGAYAEYMPEPLMLYKEAHFTSETEVSMAPGSALFLSEIACPGRTHRGEIFQYEQYQNRMTVAYDGELIFCSRQRVRPESGRLQGIGSWDRYTHLGSLYLFSDRVSAAAAEELRERIEAQAARFPDLWTGVSLTYKYGLTVSVMGQRVYELKSVLDGAWNHLREALFSLSPLAVPK